MKRSYLILILLLAVVIIMIFVGGDEPEEVFKDSFNKIQGCTGEGPVNFTYSPRRLKDIEMIEPMGLMLGSHVTPIDHQYYYPPNWKWEVTEDDLIDVIAPASGVVLNMQEMPDYFSANMEGLGDYNFEIYHSCTFYTHYIHLYKLSPTVQKALEGEKVWVEAGEVIGQANSFDFSVHNTEKFLNFIVPENYEREKWKIHTVDPNDYFNEPLRSQLIAKTIRTAAPVGGKIDYDVDGKLIGNWFVENTNGYAGIYEPEYWKTHLSISPDALDPKYTIISLGDFQGEARQFGAKGGMPDPSTLGVEAGLLKYELIQFGYTTSTGERWDNFGFATGLTAVDVYESMGTILLQLVEDRKLKVEIFPGKSAEAVTAFTNNVVVYER